MSMALFNSQPFLSFFAAPPVFLVRPPALTRVRPGAPASIDCVSAGSPAPTVFWMKEGGSGVLLPGDRQGGVRVRQEGTIVFGE